MVINIGTQVTSETLTSKGFQLDNSWDGIDSYSKFADGTLIEVEVAGEKVKDIRFA